MSQTNTVIDVTPSLREHRRELLRAKYGVQSKHHDKKKQRERRQDYLLRLKYNITLEDFQALIAAQYFSCAICQQPFAVLKESAKGHRPHVDHRHSDGKVRGLLCNNCNRGLGYFQDDPEIAQAAVEYLRRHL
jgi:hypothetical protein